MALSFFRNVTGDADFLNDAMRRALTWMDYQSPGDRLLVAQLPTSDWRDEQWVLGFGLFVNTIVFTYLRSLGYTEKADLFRHQLGQPVFEIITAAEPTGRPSNTKETLLCLMVLQSPLQRTF